MEGKKLTNLKKKSFDSIQKMFDRAFERVNTFIDFKTELVEESSKKAKAKVMEGSSKRAGTELEQESSKKQKIDDDKETAELKHLDLATPVIERNVTESLEAVILERSSSQPKSTYEAAASLLEFELTKIILDKMEENKSHLIADYKKKLYDALVESYNTDKDLFNTYEEPSHRLDDSEVQQNQEFVTGNNDEQPTDKETWISHVAHAKEPRTSFNELMDTSFDLSVFVLNRLNIKYLTQEILVGLAFELLKGTCKSLTELEYHLKDDHNGRQVIPHDFFINNDLEYLKGGDLSKRYSTLGTSHWGPKRQHFYGFPANMSSSKDVYYSKRIIEVIRLSIMKKYDYGHLEEIEVYREDQKLYKFREGDFPRLRLQDIDDMLLLPVQKKLTNLIINEWSNLKNKTTYTTYSDPKGVIYKDQMNKNRLMRADELHKFGDGTLDDVWSALNNIAKGIRMEYLPKRK
nr:hypothetical protein [Tanacetum cinerariifolium]